MWPKFVWFRELWSCDTKCGCCGHRGAGDRVLCPLNGRHLIFWSFRLLWKLWTIWPEDFLCQLYWRNLLMETFIALLVNCRIQALFRLTVPRRGYCPAPVCWEYRTYCRLKCRSIAYPKIKFKVHEFLWERQISNRWIIETYRTHNDIFYIDERKQPVQRWRIDRHIHNNPHLENQ